MTSQDECPAINDLLDALRSRLGDSAEHLKYLDNAQSGIAAVHLAIMHEPFLTFIIQGRKTIESRFSMHRVAPYDHVTRGDLLLLKKLSAPISAIAIVDEVMQYRLNEVSWSTIYDRYACDICAPDEFYLDKINASYATLMRVACTREIAPLEIPKHDRRGWVVLIDRQTQLPLF